MFTNVTLFTSSDVYFLEVFSALGQTGQTLASYYAVSVFTTTAVGLSTGISALEFCILKNEFLEGVRTTAAFICPLLPALC